ncbi:hypothetical protein P7H00_01370 [Enterococcus pseudoavium]|uniref:Uncharacterized protein n=1 Tax=Enterococcus pseudoavium TaxID=44007 RepID=A0AAE4I0E6_9ENTE|nr:hypothetical protein [Enterococcus pseudoavium]MDT2735780.1 hypothetical protein [Enterococcus pseudoavium]
MKKKISILLVLIGLIGGGVYLLQDQTKLGTDLTELLTQPQEKKVVLDVPFRGSICG